MKDPAPSTLARYGLTLEQWKRMGAAYDWRCHCCGREPSRLVIDHVHVKGWKNMPSELRRRYVRGLLCDRCNHWVLTQFADAEVHRQAAEYLDRYSAWEEKNYGGRPAAE